MREDAIRAEREATSSSGPPDVRGRRFGDFEIIARLGSGGMGEVYLARQVSLSREVALKLLSPALASKPAALDRFLRESKIAASIDHPSVVAVIASGVTDGRPWIALRLVRGVSLEAVLEARGALGVEESLSAASRIARALQAAHEAGIVHRDVKPGNVLVEGDPGNLARARVYLADFGLAAVGDGTTLTHSGEILGTPAYMSPEQASGAPLDARSDIYSLGATLYAMLTGRPPFEAESYFAVLDQVRTRDPVPLRKRNPSVDRDAAVVCEKAMRWDPKERYASAAEFAGDLEARLAHRPIRARPPSAGYRARLWIRRNPVVAAAAAIAFLAALAGFSAERAWRRSAALERASALLARGQPRAALEVVEDAPSLPWPFQDARRLSLLAECAAAVGDPARAVRAADPLPAAPREEAFRRLRELLSRQVRAARRLAEHGGWWAALKILREVLEGLEAFPARAPGEDGEAWFDSTSLACAEAAALAFLEAGKTEEGIELWEVVSREPDARSPKRARARLARVRRAWSGALSLGGLVMEAAPGDYLEASTLGAFDRGFSLEAAEILLEHGVRVRAAEAFPPPEALEESEVESRDEACARRRREALRMLYVLDAYRHVFPGPSGDVDALEEIEDWTAILERLRPAGPPIRTRGDLRSHGDLDGDGSPEVLFSAGREFSLATWTEDGLLADAKFQGALRGDEGAALAAAAIADVIPGGPSELLQAIERQGEGRWSLRICGWHGEDGFVPLAPDHPTSLWTTRLSPGRIAAGDFDRDGEIELAVGLDGPDDPFRRVQIIEDLARPGPEPVYLPDLVKTGDGEASVAADTKAVFAGDFDGDGDSEIGAVTGPWKGYDVRFWNYDASARAYEGPLRIGPLGNCSVALALDADGAPPLEILIAFHPFYGNPRAFPKPPHTGVPYGLYLLRLPGPLTPESAARWSVDPESLWIWKELLRGDYSDFPARAVGPTGLSAATLPPGRAAVAAAFYEKRPAWTQAAIDLLLETRRGGFRRHRLVSSREPGLLSAAILARRDEGGRTFGLLVSHGASDGSPGPGSARVWELGREREIEAPLSLAAIEGFARLGRFEEAAAAAERALEETRKAGGESDLEPRYLLASAAARARAHAWEEAVETLAALRGALESRRPRSFPKERREAARWTEIAELSLRLSRSERRSRAPGDVSVRLDPLAPEGWIGPEILFEHPERISVESPARIRLRGEISIERLGWDRSVFVGLVPEEASQEGDAYGISFGARGGTERPIRGLDLAWGRTKTGPLRLEEGRTYAFLLEVTGEDRLALRLEDSGGDRAGRARYAAFPSIDRWRPLAPDSGLGAPVRVPKGAYRFVVAGHLSRPPYELPRATAAAVRNLELRVDP